MGYQVGRWDCRHCGHRGNLGPETKCVSCGAPRDPDIKFYLPEDAEYISDEQVLEQAGQGANWNCDHCGADNVASAVRCRSCGNPRTDEDVTREQVEYTLDEVPHSDRDTRGEKKDMPPPPRSSGRKKKGLIGCLAIVAVVIGLVVYLAWPRDTTVTIAGHDWERTMAIEAYRQVQEEGWSLPAGAKSLRTYRAIHHYDRILDHYETRTRTKRVKVGQERYKCGKIDKGNGYFKDKYCTRPKYENRRETYKEAVYRKEPVFRTKYVYQVYKWVQDRVNRASGKKKPAQWPEGPPQSKDWRAGKKTEKYIILFTDKKDKRHQEEVPYDFWEKHNVGDKVKAQSNLLGRVSVLPKK